jgi:low affinity Fe/Cu permease
VTLFAKALTSIGVWTAHPAAFLLVLGYAAVWIAVGGDFGWHELATTATWLMTLLIQRAEHRDTQAIHAKLDELLRVDKKARSELAHIDREEPEEIETHRALDGGT